MTRARQLIERFGDEPSKGKKREQHLVQYADRGNSASTTIKTKAALEAAVYTIGVDMSGAAYFTLHETEHDEMLRFEDPRYAETIKEIQRFWASGPKYEKRKFCHTRGIGLEGPPGSGKTMLLNQVEEWIVGEGDVVFTTRDVYSLAECLKQFREVEPNRKVVVRLEDFDDMMYAENTLLNLLDGDKKVNRVLYLATTNHYGNLSERIKRPGRFDRWVNIPQPPAAGRHAYLSAKLADQDPGLIEQIVDKTDGMSFGALKELIVSVYCLDNDLEETIERLRTHMNLTPHKKNRFSTWTEAQVKSKVAEAKAAKGSRTRAQILLETDARLDIDTPVIYDPNKKAEPGDGATASQAQSMATATSWLPQQPDAIQAALTKKIDQLGFEGIMVDEVDVELDGITTVYFSDTSGNELGISFVYDETDGAQAVVLDDYSPGENAVIIDLDTLAPPLIASDFGQYINMVELSWLNRTTLATIFSAADIGDDPGVSRISAQDPSSMDAYGNVLGTKPESIEKKTIRRDGVIWETSYKTVIRGGKKARLPIVRHRKVQSLTASARMAIGRRRGTPEGKTRARSLTVAGNPGGKK